jgi:hypothetical protein
LIWISLFTVSFAAHKCCCATAECNAKRIKMKKEQDRMGGKRERERERRISVKNAMSLSYVAEA